VLLQDDMLQSVQRYNVYFIHCLLPRHTAAVCKPSTSPADKSSLNLLLLRNQLRGTQLLDALLIQKQGYSYELRKKHHQSVQSLFYALGCTSL